MRNRSDIQDFINVFVYDDLPGVVKKYAEFQKSAILSADNYKDLCKELDDIRFEWEIDKEKKWIYNSIEFFVKYFSENGMDKEEKRQELLTVIEEKMNDTYTMLTEMNKYMYNTGIRYLTLHIVSDIIFAFSDIKNKIILSAMFQERLHKMGEQGDEEFNKFYGKEAENELLESTFNNLFITCYSNEINPMEIISLVSSETELVYIKEFCRQLEGLCQTHPVIELSGKNKRKKKKSITKEKDNSENVNESNDGASLSEAENFSMSENEKSSKGFLIPVIFVTGILVSLAIGLIIGNKFGPSGKALEESEVMVSEMETTVKKLTDENKKLKADLKKYENSDKEDDTSSSENDTEAVEDDTNSEETANSEEAAGSETEEATEEGVEETETSTEEIEGDVFVLDTYRMIRSGRGASTDALATGATGESVIILEPQDEAGWAKVKYGEIEGYMYIPY